MFSQNSMTARVAPPNIKFIVTMFGVVLAFGRRPHLDRGDGIWLNESVARCWLACQPNS
jgi:hypothetical protein